MIVNRRQLKPGPVLALAGLLALPAPSLGEPERPDLAPADLARVSRIIRPTTDFTKAEPFEAMQAGATTSIEDPDRLAFSHFSANLDEKSVMDFQLGNALFRKIWVPAPSSTQASDGLGPFYNARSCEACHRDDGRGHPPLDGATDFTSIFLRLGRGPRNEAEEEAIANGAALNFPDRIYGGQLQDKAIAGLKPEGRMTIRYEDRPFEYPDGTRILLRKPTYEVEDLRYGPLEADVRLSPRVAPSMIGLGLIEAIRPEDLIANERSQAGLPDISGRLQQVRTLDGKVELGRFGWKGEQARLSDQAAHAFSGDIGISTPPLPDDAGDCTSSQADCRAKAGGTQPRLGKTEAPDPVLDLVAFYSRHLAVPARRRSGATEILKGKQLFYESGCIACHRPKYVTSKEADDAALRYQLIWPYSDFLLHDMGEGLADGQPVGRATGREWKTPALWGIGLTKTVGGRESYLHDGRARTLEEAILWHGGEAEPARTAFAAKSRDDRQKLIAFLESL